MDHGKQAEATKQLLAYRAARAAFETWCAMGDGGLPPNPISALQLRLHRWQENNFPGSNAIEQGLGVVEEVGELAETMLGEIAPFLQLAGMAAKAGHIAHVLLKRKQKIRGYTEDEKFRSEIADAIADITVFSMSLCTCIKVDFGALLFETVERIVIKRDFVARPVTG